MPENNAKFNSAAFLDHHWFQNAIHLFTFKGESKKNHNLSVKKTLDRITGCHETNKLSIAINDVPSDIMLFLSMYIFPAEELSNELSEEEFISHYRIAKEQLTELMQKYTAHSALN